MTLSAVAGCRLQVINMGPLLECRETMGLSGHRATRPFIPGGARRQWEMHLLAAAGRGARRAAAGEGRRSGACLAHTAGVVAGDSAGVAGPGCREGQTCCAAGACQACRQCRDMSPCACQQSRPCLAGGPMYREPRKNSQELQGCELTNICTNHCNHTHQGIPSADGVHMLRWHVQMCLPRLPLLLSELCPSLFKLHSPGV